mmetsp:Transcript_23032/g.58684  ORF Transcript_23032/g.58684 Transcript_23032/m.58684 type:complete len:228 (+) Transcript_23032:237-920(+)
MCSKLFRRRFYFMPSALMAMPHRDGCLQAQTPAVSCCKLPHWVYSAIARRAEPSLWIASKYERVIGCLHAPTSPTAAAPAEIPERSAASTSRGACSKLRRHPASKASPAPVASTNGACKAGRLHRSLPRAARAPSAPMESTMSIVGNLAASASSAASGFASPVTPQASTSFGKKTSTCGSSCSRWPSMPVHFSVQSYCGSRQMSAPRRRQVSSTRMKSGVCKPRQLK